jgi:hypothetical protein
MLKKADIAREYVKKYIEIAKEKNTSFSKRYIAKVIHAENPDRFKSVEDARSYVRGVTGSNIGNRLKPDLKEAFLLMESGIKEIDTSPFIFPKDKKKILVVNDLHSQFYNKKALEIAFNDAINWGADSILINGDFLDFYGKSSFDKDPRLLRQLDEQEWGQDMLQLMQDTFGYVVLKEGNHDMRLHKYINNRFGSAPELIGMLGGLKDYLFFDGCKVNFVEDYRRVKLGSLTAIHGHELGGGGGIQAARNRMLRTFTNTISAHSHIANTNTVRDLDGKYYISCVVGCLCDLNPRYAPMNQWVNGYAKVELDGQDFEIDNRRIDGGKSKRV